MQDPFGQHRDLLHEAIRRRLDAVAFTHGELMREQFAAANPADYELAALVCLRVSEVVGGSREAALPAATALALLAQMGLVFNGLESQHGSASLSTAWGMPRSLNAGDAFFAEAQASVLQDGELTAETRFEAVQVLDEATWTYLAAVNAAAEGEDATEAGQRALLAAAVTLGAIYGAASKEARSKLESLASSWAQISSQELAVTLAGDFAAGLVEKNVMKQSN